MSVVEQPREMTQQEKIDWDYSYTQAGGLDNWIPNPLDFIVKNCCDKCAFFLPMDERDEDGLCLKNVANDLSGQYILGSDTFYCSYYRFINSLGSGNG